MLLLVLYKRKKICKMYQICNQAVETMVIGDVLKELEGGKLSPELGRDGFRKRG